MKTININNSKVEIYDSIEELPTRRFHKFNKFMLIDAGIGSDLNDINAHIYKVMKFIDGGDTTSAKQQLENLRQSLYLIAQETSAKHLSFTALVRSIDGVEVTDLSDENLNKILNVFNSETASGLDNLIDSLKKKFEDELSIYFPGHSDDAIAKEQFDKIKQRTLLTIRGILDGADYAADIDLIDVFLVGLSKPQTFAGSASAEVHFEKTFEEMNIYLLKESGINVNSTTVLQYYSAFEYLKKQAKNNAKNGK